MLVAATVFFEGSSELATLDNTFTVSGSPADPDTVACSVTDPAGNATVHTYAGASPADITRAGTGDYRLNVPCVTVGMWGYTWVGTGVASDVIAGTWSVNPSATISQLYTSIEELKDRLNITDTASDFGLLAAVQAAARAIEAYCGRHFYPLAETRSFVPYTLYELPLDDLVSVTALRIDRDGDGVYEEAWTQGVDYELAIGPGQYNQMATGEARPYTLVRVIDGDGGGRFFPFTWAFSRLDRIQVTGIWGWPEVPYAVREAAMSMAAEIWKLKDSPFGIAGNSEFGMIRLPSQNPYVARLLSTYVNGRKVGL